MKSNINELVMMSVQGKVDHPGLSGNGMRVGYDGKGRLPLGVGGIVYNFKIGDSAMHVCGDHIEPGVSLKNPNDKENMALQAFACVGNEAIIISGDAKGSKGYVSGKHGGIDHVMVYFDRDTLDKMTCNDQVLIKAYGQGLRLDNYPDLHIMNIDPYIFEKMIISDDNKKLEIGVTHIIPAFLMGSGLGVATTMEGDYDIMTQDKEANQQYHLDDLRFGDIVAIVDHNNHYGPHYLKGAISIGVIVHSDSFTSGHGPGVTVLASALRGEIVPVIDREANLKNYLKID